MSVALWSMLRKGLKDFEASPPGKRIARWWPWAYQRAAATAGFLGRQKDSVATIQSVATVIALVIAGWWTLRLFDPVAQTRPNIYVSQTAELRRLGNGLLDLHVTFLLENTGKVTAYLTCAVFIISQVLPAEPDQLASLQKGAWDSLTVPNIVWPKIKWKLVDLGKDDFFVEAGNKAPYGADFVFPETVAPDVSDKVGTIQIYSNFQSVISHDGRCRLAKNGGLLGPSWVTTTFYDIQKSEDTK